MVTAGRISALALLAMLLSLFCALPASALELDIPSEYNDFTESLPEDLKNMLPSDAFELGGEGSALADFISPRNILATLSDIFGFKAKDALSMLSRLLFIILISAVFDVIGRGTDGRELSEPFSICTSAVFTAVILGEQVGLIRSVSLFLTRLCSLVNSMIPLVGVLYAAGGNVGAASSGTASLSFFILICENFCKKTLLPIVGVCIAFAISAAFSERSGTAGFAASIKRAYTFALGALMTVMSLVMSAQTVLSSRADSLSARAMKYAVGSYIPVIGGSIGESLRTVGASVDYIRASVGTLGIVLILLLLLPTLISLVLASLSLSVSGLAARLLGRGREAALIGELESIYGYMIAVCSLSSVLFIYALTVFIRSMSAV